MWNRWWQRRRNKTPNRAKRRPRRHGRRASTGPLCGERLEDRTLLAANLSVTELYTSTWDAKRVDDPVVGARVHLAVAFSTQDLPMHCGQADVFDHCVYSIKFTLDGVSYTRSHLDQGVVDGNTLHTASSGLSANAYWLLDKGWHTLTVELDSDNDIAEADETDNVLSVNLFVTDTFESPFGETRFVRPLDGIPYHDWTMGYLDVDGNFTGGPGPFDGEPFDPSFPDPAADYRGGLFTYDGHDAHDIGPATFADQDIGMPIRAAATGVVVNLVDGHPDRLTFWCGDLNPGDIAPESNFIVIDHGNQWTTYYHHLRTDSAAVSVGDLVKAGERIGLVGSSGCSTAPHLHFATYYQGVPVETQYAPDDYWYDPVPYRGDVAATVLDFGITDHGPSAELVGTTDVKPTLERPAEKGVFEQQFFSGEIVYFWFVPNNFRPQDEVRVLWTRPGGSISTSGAQPWTGQLWYAFDLSWELLPWGHWSVALQHRRDSTEPWVTLAEDQFLVSNDPTELAGQFEFNSHQYYITENGHQATISVIRSGDKGTATIDYTTFNGSAKAGSDYHHTAGTLTFNDGELVKTFTVPVVNDQLHAPDETLFLLLTNPTGGTLGTQWLASLTIIDDDALIQLSKKATPTGPDVSSIDKGVTIKADTELVHDVIALSLQGDDLVVEVNGEVCVLPQKWLETVNNPVTHGDPAFGLAPDTTYVDLQSGEGQDQITIDLGRATTYIVSELTVASGALDDTIEVYGTISGAPVMIDAGSGDDTIIIGGPQDTRRRGDPRGGRSGGSDPPEALTVDMIYSLVAVDGGSGPSRDRSSDAGHDLLIVNDAAANTPKTVTVTDQSVGMAANDDFFPTTGGAIFSSTGGVLYSSISTLQLLMGAGADTVFAESTHQQTETFIKSGAGADTILVENTAGTVNGIRNLLDVDGQLGYDVVRLKDIAETAITTATVTPAQVGAAAGDNLFGGGYLNYSGLGKLSLETGSNNDLVLVTGTAAGTETRILLGAGDDQVLVDSSGLAAGGVVNQIASALLVDGGGGADSVHLADVSAATASSLTITDTQVGGGATDHYFGVGGSLTYSNLAYLLIETGQAADTVTVAATAPGTLTKVSAGMGADTFVVDSNGSGAGGSVDGVAGPLLLDGGPGSNSLLLNDVDDPTGDTVSVWPLASQSGEIGAAAGDDFFAPGGRLSYERIASAQIVTGQAADTIHLRPDFVLAGTVFSIAAGQPTFADPARDVLYLDLNGVAVPQLLVTAASSGNVTSTTHAPVFFAGIERVEVVPGPPFDLVLDMNAAALGGNDTVEDHVELLSGDAGGQKTLELRVNAQPVFAAVEAAVNSLTVIGSSDEDNLIVVETSHGLPALASPAPSAHVNPQFTGSGLAPAHVGLHFDGGPGAAEDRLELVLAAPHAVNEFPDVVATANSGVVNVEGALTLSYESLSPIDLRAAGGPLLVDAGGLLSMTQMTLVDLGSGLLELDGNGGFEKTTFSGFDQFLLSLPDGVPLSVGEGDRPAYRVTKQHGRLTIVSDRRDSQLHTSMQDGSLTVDFDGRINVGFLGVQEAIIYLGAGLGSIRGQKFHDINTNGMKDPGEPGLNGWRILLTGQTSTGVPVAELRVTQTMDLNGDSQIDPETEMGLYRFDTVAAGTYVVSEQLHPGWVQTAPQSPLGTYDLVMTDGAAFEGLDFGNAKLGAIHGQKFHDLNGDGIKQPGEPGLDGWRIRMVGTIFAGATVGQFRLTHSKDLDGNGVIDPSTEMGLYWFEDVSPGAYTISEDLLGGWLQTAPQPVPPGSYEVTLSSGQTVEHLDFGNARGVSIHGKKLHDQNGNGVKDSGEPTLAGWTITLDKDADGSVDYTTTTSATGGYSFVDLLPGTYRVREHQQPGWTQSSPDPIDLVLASAATASGIDFGNTGTSSIHGQKFHDLDADGIRDPGEPGLDGWRILLTGTTSSGASVNVLQITHSMDVNGDSQIDPETETGLYWFENVVPGTYVVSEQLKPGWVQTAPQTPFGVHHLGISDTATVEGLDFGNLDVRDMDFGDAPDDPANPGFGYRTLISSNGARHKLPSNLLLGTKVDAETDGFPTIGAIGDDTHGQDDEDGVIPISTLLATGVDTKASVSLFASATGLLDAWIDFDGNGVFDHPAERIGGQSIISLAAGWNIVAFTVPADAAAGLTYARFRFSSAGGLGPGGVAADGEVEDYRLTIAAAGSAASVAVPEGRARVSAERGDLLVHDGAGRLLFAAPLAGVESLTLEGADDRDDTLQISFEGGNPVPRGGLSFHGGRGGYDSLELVGGAFSEATYRYDNAHDGSILLVPPADDNRQALASSIHYTGLEPITNSGTADDIIFELPAGADHAVLEDDGDPANGLSRLRSMPATFETTSFANPANSLTINTHGGDTVVVTQLDNGFDAALMLNGDMDQDVFDLSNLTLTRPISLHGGGGGDVATLAQVHVSGSAADGLLATDLASLNISQSTFHNNTGHGIRLTNAGVVALIDIAASGNGAAGLAIEGAASLSDSHGTYSENVAHGIHLKDIAGDVTLLRTTADDNNTDSMGANEDGLYAEDGDDSDHWAIAGALLVRGGRFRNTGATLTQQHGLQVVSLAGPATLENSDDGQQTEMTRNALDGVKIDGQESATAMVIGGIYSDNVDDGIELDGFGELLLVDARSERNVVAGLDVDPVKSKLSVIGGLFNGNKRGIDLKGKYTVLTIENASFDDNFEAGLWLEGDSAKTVATLTNVTADGNTTGGLDGLVVSQMKSVTINGGSFNKHTELGIDATDVDFLELYEVAANDNGVGGVSLAAVDYLYATKVTAKRNPVGLLNSGLLISFSDTDGDYSDNSSSGVSLNDVSGNVTLVRTIADNNNDGAVPGTGFSAGTISGNLEVRGSRFRDQGTGVSITSVSGSVLFDDAVDASGQLQTNEATGNSTLGGNIGGIGTTATFINGRYSQNGWDGLNVKAAGMVTLTDVQANDNKKGAGVVVHLTAAADVEITGGSFSDNGDLLDHHGVRLSGSPAMVQIHGATFEKNAGDGLSIAGNGAALVELENVTSSGNGDDGLDLHNIAELQVTGGSFSDNKSGAGIEMDEFSPAQPNVTLDGVTVDGNGRGVFLVQPGDVTISGGAFSNSLSTTGITLVQPKVVTIDGTPSVFGNFSAGLVIDAAESVEIKGGTFSNNKGTGIVLGTTTARVQDSIIQLNSIGLSVQFSTALVQNNDLSHNKTVGLEILGSAVDAGGGTTALGSSTGGNVFYGYVTDGGLAIRNLNSGPGVHQPGDPIVVPPDAWARFNDFGALPLEIEKVIFHDLDDPLLGFVDYSGALFLGTATPPVLISQFIYYAHDAFAEAGLGSAPPGSGQRSVIRAIQVVFAGPVAVPTGRTMQFELTREGPDMLPWYPRPLPTGPVPLQVESSRIDGSTGLTTVVLVPDEVAAAEFLELGSLIDGNYRLTVDGDAIELLRVGSGELVDGDGDGRPGGDRVEYFFRLFGDSEADQDVDGDDEARLVQLLQGDPAAGVYLAVFDFNSDRRITREDQREFRRRRGSALPADFGDAPDSYGTRVASNGARHLAAAGPRLGQRLDLETDGQPSGAAAGDDNTDLDDEDGVTFNSTLLAGATTTITVLASAAGKLDAWIDFNDNGAFNASEQIFASQDVVAGSNLLAFAVPADASIGRSYARLRLSTAGGLGPTGSAADGEVEDYLVRLVNHGRPVTVSLPPGGGELARDADQLLVRDSMGRLLFGARLSSLRSLTLEASDGADDLLQVLFDTGNPIPEGGLTFHGGAGGQDSLELSGGSFGQIRFRYASAQDGDILLQPHGPGGEVARIRYSGLEPITQIGGVDDLVFELPPGADNAWLEDDGDSHNGQSRLRSTPATFETTVFSNPASSLTIKTDGSDTINVMPLDGGFDAALTLQGTDAAESFLIHNFVSRRPIRVDARGGDDLLRFHYPAAAPIGLLLLELDGGAGDDLFDILLDTNSERDDRWSIHARGGAGSDRMGLVQRGRLAGELAVRLDGGGGADALDALFDLDPDSLGALLAELFGGGDDDELSLQIRAARLAALDALLDGGRRHDRCRVTGNVQVVRCEG